LEIGEKKGRDMGRVGEEAVVDGLVRPVATILGDSDVGDGGCRVFIFMGYLTSMGPV
jgi:hypothetical protein